MPKVLPEYLELRRQQILDAAAACFARRGFHQTTMQDICTEVELSPGAVYRYFPSKESIIQAMCEHGQTQNADAISNAFQRESTLDIFSELIRIFFLELEQLHSGEYCALTLELITEAPRNEAIREWVLRNNSETRARFVGLIEASQDRGEIDPSLSPDSVAQVMVGLYWGFIAQKLLDPSIDVVKYTEVMKSLFAGSFWCGEAAASGPEFGAALRH